MYRFGLKLATFTLKYFILVYDTIHGRYVYRLVQVLCAVRDYCLSNNKPLHPMMPQSFIVFHNLFMKLTINISIHIHLRKHTHSSTPCLIVCILHLDSVSSRNDYLAISFTPAEPFPKTGASALRCTAYSCCYNCSAAEH